MDYDYDYDYELWLWTMNYDYELWTLKKYTQGLLTVDYLNLKQK